MKLHKIIAAAAVSAAWLISAPASAGVIGSADLAITSFLIISNNAPVTSGISIIADSRTGTANSNFNGAVGSGAGAGSISAYTPGQTVDVKYRCAGPDCGTIDAIYGGTAENNTTTHFSTPVGNFSLGDMLIAGNAIGVSPTGANGYTRADASVTGSTNQGGSNATILNSVSAMTTFSVDTTMTAMFALSYDAFVAAYVDPLLPANEKGIASGAISWNLNLTSLDDPTFVSMNWSPTELNRGYISTNGAGNHQYTGAGNLTSDFRTLNAGKTYSLTINQASNALASQVPEPGSMVLIGLGLFALAGASRRRIR
jgi:hypothetical protein